MDLEEVTPIINAKDDQWILERVMTLCGGPIPELPILLSVIVSLIVNPRDLPPDPENWTSEMLKDYPQLVQELSQGWQERSFARVRGMMISP